ncbi:ubiquitin-conjugating enzyme E2 T-like [Ptychodera flava]|uniref:ubiquitin-conjugating enzyme E2 T-like n=1 Tax=Ptychodera flava TaxID=63121 RepID=UPI00396A9BE8
MQRAARMKREIQMFEREPPHGISCWMKKDKFDELEARIIGGTETPYTGGVFKLEIQVPERYPFEPPKVRFLTPIYHPNIDNGGRICLDILKMPPGGSWKPSLNISTVLKSIQLLMADPNPDDPLMADISNEYKFNRHQFIKNAKQWTETHAMSGTTAALKIQSCGKDKENDAKISNPSTESESDESSDDEEEDQLHLESKKRKRSSSEQQINKVSRS